MLRILTVSRILMTKLLLVSLMTIAKRNSISFHKPQKNYVRKFFLVQLVKKKLPLRLKSNHLLSSYTRNLMRAKMCLKAHLPKKNLLNLSREIPYLYWQKLDLIIMLHTLILVYLLHSSFMKTMNNEPNLVKRLNPSQKYTKVKLTLYILTRISLVNMPKISI